MSSALLRNRYVSDNAATATPAQLVTMLYDRLVLDLVRAETAQRAGDRHAAGKQLIHAQSILLELMSSLRIDDWEGGEGLLALYTYLHTELINANIGDDPDVTANCRLLVEPLRDAWREAAAELSRTGAVPAASLP